MKDNNQTEDKAGASTGSKPADAVNKPAAEPEKKTAAETLKPGQLASFVRGSNWTQSLVELEG